MADQTAVDYLGLESPVSIAEKSALPTGAGPLGITTATPTASGGGVLPSTPSGPNGTAPGARGASSGTVITSGSGVPGVPGDPAAAASAATDATTLQKIMEIGGLGQKALTVLKSLGVFKGAPDSSVLNPADFTLYGEGGEPVIDPSKFSLDGAGGEASLDPSAFTLGKVSLNDKALPAAPSVLDVVGQSLRDAGLNPDQFRLTGGDAASPLLDPGTFSFTGDGGAPTLSPSDYSFDVGNLAESGAEGAASGIGGALGTASSLAGYGMAAKGALDVLNARDMDTDQKVHELLGKAGQFVANIYAPGIGGVLADLVHKYISTPFVESLFGKFGPSKAWQTFPQHMVSTLTGIDGANQQFVLDLARAEGPDAIQGAAQKWRQAVTAAGVGDFMGRPGDIPDLPGASGTRHEGGITADFSPITEGLRAELESARSGADPIARVRAFWDAMQHGLSVQDMTKTAPIAATGDLTPGQSTAVNNALGLSVIGKPRAAVASDVAAKIEDLRQQRNTNPNTAAVESMLGAAEGFYRELTGQDYATAEPTWSQQQYDASQAGGG